MRDFKKLQYFVGKVCTVLTVPINRDFRSENPATYPEPLFLYFLGVVESLDETCVVLRQVQSGRKTCLMMDKVVGVAEEEVLDPDDPKNAAVMKQFDKPETPP